MARRPGRRRRPWSVTELPDGLLPTNDLRPPDWHSRGTKLVGVYNQCLKDAADRGGFALVVKRPNETTCAIFFALELWCRERDVDASAWVFAMFASLSWCKPVSLSVLFDEKRKRIYDGLYPSQLRSALGVSAIVRENLRPAGAFRPFRDLYPLGAEVAKRGYVARGKHDLCMADVDITFGYHPQSEFCPTCPLRTPCHERTVRLAKEMDRK